MSDMADTCGGMAVEAWGYTYAVCGRWSDAGRIYSLCGRWSDAGSQVYVLGPAGWYKLPARASSAADDTEYPCA